MASFN